MRSGGVVKRIHRLFCVEAPDTIATVDFLSHGASVEIAIDGDEIVVKVRVSHGEDSSTWDASELRAKLVPR